MDELRFRRNYSYSLNESGIVVPVYAQSGVLGADVFAKVDIGAEWCLFERNVAIKLDIEVDQGEPMLMSTLTGNFLAYGHEVTLTLMGMSFVLTVYFAANDAINRNLLGRNWLRLVKLGVVDYEGKLFLSPYDDDNEW